MPNDPIAVITDDHRKVERLFEKALSGGPPDPRVVDELVTELTVHATVEEQALYPAIRDAVDGGASLVREATKEHDEARKLLARVRRAKDRQLIELLTKLRQEVEHHVEEEESEILPQLSKALDRDAMATVGQQVEQAKRLAMGRAEEVVAEVEAASRRGETGGGRPKLVDLTKAELYERARKAGISGRSRMTKDELVDALRRR